MSLFLGTPELKHYFPTKVKHCLNYACGIDNQVMLDAREIAKRLREAMDEAKPPIRGSDLAIACGVTPQAISGWRETGRLAKRHLPTISRVTGRSVEYFIAETVPSSTKNVQNRPWVLEKVVDEDQFLIVFRTWQDARSTDRENLVAIAKAARKAHGTRRRRIS